MAVSNRAERFGVRRDASGKEPSHLFHEAAFEHALHTFIDAPVGLLAWGIQTHRTHLESLQRTPGLHFQMLGEGLARLQPYFKGSNDLGLVTDRDTAGRVRITRDTSFASRERTAIATAR